MHYLPRDAMDSANYAVCLSDTRRYCVRTAEHYFIVICLLLLGWMTYRLVISMSGVLAKSLEATSLSCTRKDVLHESALMYGIVCCCKRSVKFINWSAFLRCFNVPTM